MSDDAGDGRLRLEGDAVRVDWAGAGDLPVFDANDGVLRTATDGLGAESVRNPLWAPMLHDSLITVHPLGGCAMGDDGTARRRRPPGPGLRRRRRARSTTACWSSTAPSSPGRWPSTPCSRSRRWPSGPVTCWPPTGAGPAAPGPTPPLPVPPPTETVGVRFTERMAGLGRPSADGDSGGPAAGADGAAPRAPASSSS